jgi:hypothetical protein
VAANGSCNSEELRADVRNGSINSEERRGEARNGSFNLEELRAETVALGRLRRWGTRETMAGAGCLEDVRGRPTALPCELRHDMSVARRTVQGFLAFQRAG